jgi:hypothetical protein
MNVAWALPRCAHRLDPRWTLPTPVRSSPLLAFLLAARTPPCRRAYASLLPAGPKPPPKKPPPAIPRPRISYNKATLDKIFAAPPGSDEPAGAPPPPPLVANAVLAELQNRRVTGSLVDVGIESLPEHWKVTPAQAARALEFLRRERPMDEVGLAGVYAQKELDAERARQVEDIKARAERWGIRKRDRGEEKGVEVAGKRKTGLVDRSSFIEKLAMDLTAKTKAKKMKKMEVDRYYAAKAAEEHAEVMRRREEVKEIVEAKRNHNLKTWAQLRKEAELPTEELFAERTPVRPLSLRHGMVANGDTVRPALALRRPRRRRHRARLLLPRPFADQDERVDGGAPLEPRRVDVPRDDGRQCGRVRAVAAPAHGLVLQPVHDAQRGRAARVQRPRVRVQPFAVGASVGEYGGAVCVWAAL